MLYIGAKMGNANLVKALIENKDIEINKPAVIGKTALYISSEEGHVKTVNELLRHPTLDVNKQHSGQV